MLMPSTMQARRTRRYSSTWYIPHTFHGLLVCPYGRWWTVQFSSAFSRRSSRPRGTLYLRRLQFELAEGEFDSFSGSKVEPCPDIFSSASTTDKNCLTAQRISFCFPEFKGWPILCSYFPTQIAYRFELSVHDLHSARIELVLRFPDYDSGDVSLPPVVLNLVL